MRTPPSPVRYGDGRQRNGAPVDITAQARHFTVDALDAIAVLLRGAETDARLRFTVARFILELGWGRARAMPAPEPPNDSLCLTGALERQFTHFLETIRADDADAGPGRQGAPAAPAAGGRMAADGAAGATDAAG